MEKSKVAVVGCPSYDEGLVFAALKRGIDLLGGIGAFVKKEEKILLKPNILAGSRPEDAVTTHPAVFAAIVRLLSEFGVRPYYGDSPGFGKPAEALRKCGLAEAADRWGVQLGDFERGKSVENPTGLIGKRFDIANACLEADGIISLPKMKTHQLTRITGAVKNQFGCVYGLNKAAFHVKVPNQVNFSKMLIDLNRVLPLRLFIMDGITAMEGNGPRGGTPVPMNCIIVSADPIATDATFCRLIDLDPEFVPTITYGHETGLGNYEAEEIELLGDDFAEFRNPAFDVVRKPVVNISGKRKLPHFIGDAVFPRPVIDPAICVKCGVCVDSCPVGEKALAFRNGGKKEAPAYDYRHCIRCYCCQEMCPYKAISVRKPFLGRLLTGK
jgi:uncharacterized protein (DUF362 family)/Pyruvate/2-oxoacid:ferredoxin oxidoreductase delta subunit